MTESTAGATGWEREQALFAAAMALPPGERTGFLAVACHGDASLRRRVGALLAAEAATGGLPREPAGSNPAGLVPGTRLGPFEVGEVLGLSDRTLEKHRTYGTGPAYRKLGGRVVYAIDDLQAWANRGAVTSTSDPRGSVLPAKRHTPTPPAHASRFAR